MMVQWLEEEFIQRGLCQAIVMKKIEQQIDDCRKDNQATKIVVQCNLSKKKKKTKQAKCHKFFKLRVFIFDFKTPTTLTFHGESAD